MNNIIELRQRPDDTWTIEIQHESGVLQAIPLGPLSKEQAIRETMRRGFTGGQIRVWDKTVLAGIASGKVTVNVQL
jgi:hypothetical protein